MRSHARRHAWKNQREQQEKTKQQRVLGNNSGNQTTPPSRLTCNKTSRVVPPHNYFGEEQSYFNQCSKIREVAQLLPQRTTCAAWEYLDKTRHWVNENQECADFPLGLGSLEAVVSMQSNPSISPVKLRNSPSDPFNVFPIPLTPRLHHLIHNSKSLVFLLGRSDLSTVLEC